MIRQDLHVPLTAMVSSLALISEAVIENVPKECSDNSSEKPSEKDSGGVTRRVQSMLRNIERLVVLVNALLESQKFSTSRMQLKLEHCDLQPLVEEAAEMMHSLAEAKKLKLELSTVSSNVVCDKQKIREVLVNLLANAIKYSPPRTKISVSFHEEKDQIEVRIKDEGPGVPTEYRESIFRDFEQTPEAKEIRQGVGLGLAICKLIVEAHDGSIGVTSSDTATSFDRSMPSTGSTFWFRLAAG
jgi:signal transduction histidine kinase